MPVRLATYLLNEKRELIQAIEERHSITIKLIPDPEIDATSHLIDRENLTEQAFKATLNTKTYPKENKSINKDKHIKTLVTAVTPKTAPPKPKNDKSKGLIRKIISSLKSIFVKDEINQNIGHQMVEEDMVEPIIQDILDIDLLIKNVIILLKHYINNL